MVKDVQYEHYKKIFDKETGGFPTRTAFDGLVGPGVIRLRPHVGEDREAIERRLEFPIGAKGSILRQGMRLLQLPSPAEWEAVGKVEGHPEMSVVLSYMKGIPFSRVDLYSTSKQGEEVHDPNDLGDLVASVSLAFQFPRTIRSLTVRNARILRLKICDPPPTFADTFEKSSAEGSMAGIMFSSFRIDFAQYVAAHRRGILEVNTMEAIQESTVTPLVSSLARRAQR